MGLCMPLGLATATVPACVSAPFPSSRHYRVQAGMGGFGGGQRAFEEATVLGGGFAPGEDQPLVGGSARYAGCPAGGV